MRKTPQHFRDQIDSVGIPKRDTVGLRVTNRAPTGFNTVKGRFVCNGKRYNAEDYDHDTIVGLYRSGRWSRREGDVHVVKGASVKALVHELGHHVTLTLNDQSGIERRLNLIVRYLARECSARHGLRPYSFTDWKELLADCYKVRYCGTAEQWESLVWFFKVYGVDLVKVTAA